MQPHFWPTPSFSKRSFFGCRDTESIEAFLKIIYRPYDVVLFSSARNAIRSILISEGIGKSDYIGVPAYTSTCVLNAISQVSIPSQLFSENNRTNLIYHQMGIPYRNLSKKILIEDSADSFCENAEPLFSNDSVYEVFSLPKIIGSLFGGFVVVKLDERAQRLREVRGKHEGHPNLFDAIKLFKARSNLFSDLWEGSAPTTSIMSYFALNDISEKLKSWQALLQQRKSRQKKLQNYSSQWLFDPNRHLTAVPVPLEKVESSLSKTHPQLIRHFFNDQQLGSNQMSPYFVIPIHQDISDDQLDLMLKDLHD